MNIDYEKQSAYFAFQESHRDPIIILDEEDDFLKVGDEDNSKLLKRFHYFANMTREEVQDD